MQADWFAGRLRELREAAGLSRKELADKAGFQSEAGIRNLEQGVRKPSWETVIALCQALHITCDAFMQEPAPTESKTVGGRPRKAPAEKPATEEKPAKKRRGK